MPQGHITLDGSIIRDCSEVWEPFACTHGYMESGMMHSLRSSNWDFLLQKVAGTANGTSLLSVTLLVLMVTERTRIVEIVSSFRTDRIICFLCIVAR